MDLYAQATSSLNELFAKKLTDAGAWRVTPGQAVRVAASPAGYMWVLNALGNLYVCKEPCTGNWTFIEPPGTARILDLSADAQYVYILQDKVGISKRDVTGGGNWSKPVETPPDVVTIAATSSELWADNGSGNFKCAAPCNMASWIPAAMDSVMLQGSGTSLAGPANNPTTLTSTSGNLLSGIFAPKNNVRLTSASAKTAYGVSTDGQAMKYVGGEWKPIEGLVKRIVKSVSGEMDSAAIYAIEDSGAVLRCAAPCASEKDISAVDTEGRTPDKDAPKQMAVNASSRMLWQLTPTANAGLGGSGMAVRPDSGPMDLAALTAPLDSQRDAVIDKTMNRAKALEDADVVAQRLAGTTHELKKMKTRIPPDEDPRVIKRKIEGIDLALSLRVLQIACVTVLAVLLLEIALPTPVSHALALVATCAGIALSFSAAHG